MEPREDSSPLSKQAMDLDYSSFEVEDRRRRLILLVAGFIITLACAAAFIGTIESLGSMSAHVSGVFDSSEEKADEKSDALVP